MKQDELFELIRSRRSYRRYKEEQITKEELSLILEAGLYAPNAGSRQSVRFLVLQDQEEIIKLGQVNRELMPPRPGAKVSDLQPSIIDRPEYKSGFYGAPTLITVFVPKDFNYGDADASSSLTLMMLMCESLGLGSCVIGRAKETFESEYGQYIMKEHGLGDDVEASLHLIIGYPIGETYTKERVKTRIIF